MTNLIGECDWFTRDSKSNTLYYTSESKCYKHSTVKKTLAFEELDIKLEANPTLDYNYQNNFSQNVKFSQNLSGKNIVIHGGGIALSQFR
jgi:hypothetical protein